MSGASFTIPKSNKSKRKLQSLLRDEEESSSRSEAQSSSQPIKEAVSVIKITKTDQTRSKTANTNGQNGSTASDQAQIEQQSQVSRYDDQKHGLQIMKSSERIQKIDDEHDTKKNQIKGTMILRQKPVIVDDEEVDHVQDQQAKEQELIDIDDFGLRMLRQMGYNGDLNEDEEDLDLSKQKPK
ncbi:hypothetical protein MP228_001368 [Amoeboaphelidium protococcarum]|nr:hypothetical protein MP228_001368 [Amoeboaphelidium protococcarum]